MPAIYAHRRFGLAVLEKLPEPLKSAITPYKEAYLLGFEGPDILFYHKPFQANATKKKGSDLHHVSAESFFVNAAKKICSQNADDVQNTALSAYVAGFICHFMLDNACHPRIYELEFTGKATHARIESEFDKYLLRLDGQKVFGNNVGKPFKDKQGTAKAASIALDVEESEIKTSLWYIRFINGVFAWRWKFAHKLVHALLKKLKMEDHFGGMLFHHDDDPHCDQINEALAKDLENEIENAVETVTEYFKNLEKTAETGVINKIFDKNYTGGTL